MNNCCNEKKSDSITLGIDFGTSNCLIAFLNEEHEINFIQQKKEDNLIPSKIFLEEDKSIFGHDIDHQKINEYIKSIKRIVGLTLDDIKEIENKLPFKINHENSTQNNVMIICSDKSYSVEKIIYEMMINLVEIIRNSGFKKENIEAVITVPAYFDEKARGIIKKLASLAGLSVIRLINEPTAAALAYSDIEKKVNLESNKPYIVYDLGGGTFDISVIKKYENNLFRVLGIGGNKFLGGDDFDKIIADDIKKRHLFIDKSDEEILKIAKTIKENYQGSEYYSENDLKKLFAPIIEETIKIMNGVISDCSKKFDDLNIDTVILVGGSTRLKLIEEELSKKYKILNQFNPDEIVAIGAAIHAKEIKELNKNHMLLDAVGMSFGLEVAGGGVEVFIEKNSPIPISRSQTFTTQIDNQKSIRIAICQGESKIFNENILLGKFSLEDLPEKPAGTIQIEVTFTIDADGILTVTAIESSTKKSIIVEFSDK